MSYIGKSPNLGQLYNPDRFSGTGSQTTFTLTNSVTSDQSVIVCISGVKQQVSNYSITGSSLVFDTAPPSGTNNIEVQYLGSSIDVGTVGNSAIDSAQIANDAVTAPKTDLSIVQGDVIYGSGTDAWARLGAGTSGQFLKTQGAGANPVWADAGVTDVKFLAYPASSGTNVTGAGTLYTAVYGTEVYDTANAFDGTSTFTAPETGKYLFTVSVLFSGVTSAGDGYDVQLVTSNRTYQTSHNTTNALGNQPHQMFSVIADMDSSDTAVVKILGTGESSNVWDFEGGLNNSFSGALLA